jgi:hypothetical protein
VNASAIVLLVSVPDPETVTPGPIGFLAIFFVAVAVILLGLDMVRRIRRTTYRAEIQERLKDEIAERDNPTRDTTAPGNPDTSRPE